MTDRRNGERRYDAFISYSHGGDDRIAPALQRALQRFAVPWYRRARLDIFRDQTNLAAEPHLWDAIATALNRAEHLILLASPEAAHSVWVEREVTAWLETHPPTQMVFALLEGELVWNEEEGDIDWTRTSGIPRSLAGRVVQEPRWIDLRWLRDVSSLKLRDPRLADAVADMVSLITGRPKDLLIGDEVRQRRRTRRTIVASIATLVVLTAASVVAAVTAVKERNTAVAQTKIAVSRLLAAQALSLQRTSVGTALLLARQAWQVAPTDAAGYGLVSSMLASPHLVQLSNFGDDVTGLAVDPQNRNIVAVTARGEVRTAASPYRSWTMLATVPKNSFPSMVVDARDSTVIVGTDDGTVTVVRKSGVMRLRASLRGATDRVDAVGVSSGQDVFVYATDDSLVLCRLSDGHAQISRNLFASPIALWFESNAVAVGDFSGSVTRFDLRDLRISTKPTAGIRPAGASVLTYSARPGAIAVSNAAGYLSSLTIDKQKVTYEPHPAFAGLPDSLATTSDGREVVAGTSEGVLVAPSATSGSRSQTLAGLGGSIRNIAISDNGQVIAAARGSELAVWDLQQIAPSGHMVSTGDGNLPRVARGSLLTVSPDHRWVVWQSGGVLVIYDRRRGAAQSLHLPGIPSSIAFDAKGSLVVLLNESIINIDPASGHQSTVAPLGTWPSDNHYSVVPDRIGMLQGSWFDSNSPSGFSFGTFDATAYRWISRHRSPPDTSAQSISSDGSVVVRAVPTGIEGVDPFSGKTRWNISANTGRVKEITTSPNGEMIAIANGAGEVQVYDVGTRAMMRRIVLSGAAQVIFSSDSSQIATISETGVITLIWVRTGRQVGSVPIDAPDNSEGDAGYNSSLTSVEGEWWLVSPTGYTYRLDVSLYEAAALACRLPGRHLSKGEFVDVAGANQTFTDPCS